jgi:hypothetical protein
MHRHVVDTETSSRRGLFIFYIAVDTRSSPGPRLVVPAIPLVVQPGWSPSVDVAQYGG